MSDMTRLLRRLEVRTSNSVIDDELSESHGNNDTFPVPIENRNFGPWEFVTLWVITGPINIAGWSVGSSLISLGLNVWQAMLAVIIASIVMAVTCVFSGAPGAKWHLGWANLQKAPWGVHGFLFVTVQRVFLGCIWFSVQSYWGAQCIRSFLIAIWPSFAKLNKPLANGTMTTGDFTSFILFTVCILPLMWIKPEKYKTPFMISTLVVIPVILAIFVWFVVAAKGVGKFVHSVSEIDGLSQATGNNLIWMMVFGIFTTISSFSLHIYVQLDWTRYARHPKDQILAQLLVVPLTWILIALIGIITTSCAAQLFPEQKTLLWQPFKLFPALQQHYSQSSGSRVAAAFGSLAFLMAQFGNVIAANGYAIGLDVSCLLPRWFTIQRGMWVLAIISYVIQPWALITSATKFLAVLSGYGVFIGPMTGVGWCDYFIVRRGHLRLSHIFKHQHGTAYYYHGGWNWRAPVAWCIGIWITLPGFIQRVQNPKQELAGWTQIYYISWPLGTMLSMGAYYILHLVSPIKEPYVEDEIDYFGCFGPAESEPIDGIEKGGADAKTTEQQTMEKPTVDELRSKLC